MILPLKQCRRVIFKFPCNRNNDCKDMVITLRLSHNNRKNNKNNLLLKHGKSLITYTWVLFDFMPQRMQRNRSENDPPKIIVFQI